MGMNLYPKNDQEGESVDYNWNGWGTLVGYLRTWGVDVSEFKGVNDGDPISAETCRKVSNAIADHLEELSPEDQSWLKDHPALWCYLADAGGCKQY